MNKITFLSSFFIKIFALLFMTLDHVGLYLRMQYWDNESIMQLSEVFRCLGRLALPLFAFMIVEGVLHTKNIKKYLLRLGIMASFVSLVFIILEYSNWFHDLDELLRAGNIFIDLTLLAIVIYCLKHPKWYIKLLTLLPLAFSILSFVVKGIETEQQIYIHWFPCFITMQYDFLPLLLGIGFYVAYLVMDLYIKYVVKVDKEVFEENGSYRFMVNLLMVFFATIIHIFYYCFHYIWPEGVFWDCNQQLFAIISGAFILFYSGKRGYNAKWFQFGSYLYYPVHIGIIALIMIITNGGL